MNESNILKSIHVKIMLLVSIATPCMTATGAYWSVKMQIEEKDRVTSDRISTLELKNEKSFAGKQSLESLEEEVRSMHDDVVQIKTILLTKQRR